MHYEIGSLLATLDLIDAVTRAAHTSQRPPDHFLGARKASSGGLNIPIALSRSSLLNSLNGRAGSIS